MPATQRLCALRRVMSLPVEQDLAAIGGQIAGDQIEQRRLARAVRPDDAHRLAGSHAKIDAVGRLERAERLAEAPGLEQHRVAEVRAVGHPPLPACGERVGVRGSDKLDAHPGVPSMNASNVSSTPSIFS